MPIMNGWEFLEQYAQLPGEKAEVWVLLSALLHDECQHKIKRFPFVCGFMEKPVTIEFLHALTGRSKLKS